MTQDLDRRSPAKPLPSTKSRLRRSGVANVLVMAVAAGIVGTLAIPAYAMAPGSLDQQFGATDATKLTKAQAQSVEVTDDVIAAPVTKDGYDAVTGEEIRAAEAAKAAAEQPRPPASQPRRRWSRTRPPTADSSVGDSLANPPYPSELRPRRVVYSVASQYIGTPYATAAPPCGLRLLGLRHVRVRAVRREHAALLDRSGGHGHADLRGAQPGDLVIMADTIGFYAGNGMILHAPYEGHPSCGSSPSGRATTTSCASASDR